MTARAAIQEVAGARALRALALRRKGLAYRAIGNEMGGVTIERARQLVAKGERILRGRTWQRRIVETA